MSNEIRVRTSRKKFIFIYIFIFLLIVLYPNSDFSQKGGVYNYLFFSIIAISFLYPEIKIAYSSYAITDENVIEIKGIITKKKTVIPFTSISHVIMNKGIWGTILDYGDIVVSSFTDVVIFFEGISHPEKITEIIEGKVEKEKKRI